MVSLITEHIDIWTAAQTQKVNGGRGRGNNSNGHSQYGIKKLRELILELAVRGKLVPQNPKDEPASVLLEKIAQEKARLIKEGRIKKQKPLPEISEDEKSFDLPKGWEWVRMGEVGDTNIGLTYSPSEVSDTGTPVLRANNVLDGKLNLTDLKRVDKEIKESVLVHEGDLLICARSGSRALVGKTALITGLSENMAFGAFMAIFRSRINEYLLRFINSPLFRKMIDEVNTMTINQITQNNLRSTIFPFPPLAEQHRIVAKVDELVTLCDQLEQQQTDSNATHETLVKTLLTTLTNAVDQGEFAEAWQRTANHFDTLFTTEHSIDHLKQTILQLAVMGKLVLQDPNDEPARVLLTKIAEEKERLIKEGKIKKQKPPSKIRKDEKPFELPQGWEWVRLHQIIQISSGDGLTAANMNNEGGIPVFGGNGITGYHDQANVTKPTLVIGRVGYYCGSVHITPASAWITDNAFETTFSEENIYINFLYWLLKGTNLKENENATAQPVISGRKVYPIVVGLPPTAEQQRIVGKVDELMALCDTLKAWLNEAQATQGQLADAIVEQAVA